jgi:hypothetical protein
MEILVKWLGVPVAVFALAQAGQAVRLVYTATNPASQLESAFFPDQDSSEDLSAWVLEPRSEPPRVPVAGPNAESRRSVAGRNSNPLNMKLGSGTRRYVESGAARISDIIPKDGGRFLEFESPTTGFRAAVELLRMSPYDDLELDEALRKWSNSGYASEILAGTRLDAHRRVLYLGEGDLQILLHAMAAAEGYKSSTIADEIRKALGR